ncbi:MAG: DNA repair protein RecO [Candidatus Pacebacteria bacterium]|nr:DNA repair protein RecO [Candidatus Paceibacterota bacterium]
MHHHIYHTNGFILGSKNTGEANKILTVYTKELGLIRAVTQGIRLHKSKLRFSLQDLSYAKIDFVRGRDVWRITSATSLNSFPLVRGNRNSLLLITRVSKLLERLCHGEEANEKIFNNLIQALYLLDNDSISKESKEALELHLVLSILNSLGYIGESSMLSSYLESDFNYDQTEELLKSRKSIIFHINKALSESQL